MGRIKRKLTNVQTRKVQRKEARKLKKQKKHNFFQKTKKHYTQPQPVEPSPKITEGKLGKPTLKPQKKLKKKPPKSVETIRKRQLVKANELEDKNIRNLEKKLKLNKRKKKSKTIPASFIDEGLGYILEVCDKSVNADGFKYDSDVEDPLDALFGDIDEEDVKPKSKKGSSADDIAENDDLEGSKPGDEEMGEDEMNDSGSELAEEDGLEDLLRDSLGEDEEGNSGDEEGIEETEGAEEKNIEENSTDGERADEKKKLQKSNKVREDIYGRLVDERGIVLPTRKYVPRMKRQLEETAPTHKRERLKRQMKGLLNRLSKDNIQRISIQIEELYLSNSRNDMNETLGELILEAVMQPSLTPERLVQEHGMLVAILHAHIGTETGAYFMQTAVEKFDELNRQDEPDGKEIFNIIQLLSALYNFKVSHSFLMFGILDRLAEGFREVDVELIVLMLRLSGFMLRRDDPIALKDLILKLQSKANQSHNNDGTRVNFLLECLLAIRNNNFKKIPNYDTSYCEHLKKLLHSMIRKGKSVTELRVSLQDLLDIDKKGRWWIVGSAWTNDEDGKHGEQSDSKNHQIFKTDTFNQKILDLAQRQRMNTDVRKNIFCILMTAEDYLDCYEKLMHMGLRNRQEQEIVYVVIDCCIHEREFNPYYTFLGSKLCSQERKFQMAFQFALWDRIKELHNLSETNIKNLASFVSNMLLSTSLSLAVLKIIQFADMNKHSIKFLRETLLTVLMTDSEETSMAVFHRIKSQPKLKMLREGLRLFMLHFIPKGVASLTPERTEFLKARLKSAEAVLSSCNSLALL